MRSGWLYALLSTLSLAGIILIKSDFLLPSAFADTRPTADRSSQSTVDAANGTSRSGLDLAEFAPRKRALILAENDAASGSDGKSRAQKAGVEAPSSKSRTVPITVEPVLGMPPAETSSLKAESGLPEWPKFIGAKDLFGAVKKPAPLAARAIGYYAHGCLSGAVPLPVDGPAWQEMRLSRNRNWGHPELIALLERFALDAQKFDGWPGLLVGDIAQPRGGPMTSGHASHQVGLDADIWLTPMPKRRLTRQEREDLQATSMLDSTGLAVDPKVFTSKQVALIKRAASYPEVERIFVHPAIKKALCKAAGTDRAWLGKVRPLYGHYYHFHMRIKCPVGVSGCQSQTPPTGDDGCGKEVDWWLARVRPAKNPPVPKPHVVNVRPPKPPIMLSDMPAECRSLLAAEPDPVPVPPAALMTKAAVHQALEKVAKARVAFAKAEGLAIVPAKAAAVHPALRPHLRKTTSAEKK